MLPSSASGFLNLHTMVLVTILALHPSKNLSHRFVHHRSLSPTHEGVLQKWVIWLPSRSNFWEDLACPFRALKASFLCIFGSTCRQLIFRCNFLTRLVMYWSPPHEIWARWLLFVIPRSCHMRSQCYGQVHGRDGNRRDADADRLGRGNSLCVCADRLRRCVMHSLNSSLKKYCKVG